MDTSDIELLKRVYGCIDHTTLSPTDNKQTILDFSQRTLQLCNEEIGRVATLCTWAKYADYAKQSLKGKGVEVTAVAGAFPHGQATLNAKIEEINLAIEKGADEVDVVFPLASFYGRSTEDLSDAVNELGVMRQAIGNHTAKCIIETGLLGNSEDIARATQMVIDAGYDFVKTSTGKTAVGATPEAVQSMLEVLKKHKLTTGKTIGLKVSGGVSTIDKALLYTRMAQSEMGDEYINKQTFRIGTSGLTEVLSAFLTKEIAKD